MVEPMSNATTTTSSVAPITTERHRFESHGETLVADVHRPVGADALTPVLVVTGSWTTVKEQQADFYARRLAAHGFTTVTFDFRGFGQSTGDLRDLEDPERKVEDINAAVGFARTLPGVDPDRLGAVGVCASAGYQAVNAASDHRVRALGLIAPWLHDAELVAPYYGGAEGMAARRALAAEAREVYEQTGEVRYMPAISETDESAAMFGPFDYYLDPSRGAVPEWDARLAVMSWEPWLTFNPIVSAPSIDVPVQIVHSEDGAVPDGARQFFDGLAGPKDITWTTGGQLDFYDQPAQVDVALPAIVEHFRTHL